MARPRTRQRAISTEDESVEVSPSQLPDDVLQSIERVAKVHGAKLVARATDSVECNRIPSGCFVLDFALLGGFPQGYASMIYGLESSGKTTACLRGVAAYQKKHPKKVVGWLDAEGLFDREWAERNGCNTDMMIVASPEYGEQGVDLVEEWIGLQSIGLIVIDSIPTMIPMNIVGKSAEDKTMTELARLMGVMCSKVISAFNRERRSGHWVTLWNINQFRSKVGFVLGNPLMLPGGRQINHLPTTKLWMKLKKEVMGKDSSGIDIVEYNDQAFKLEKTKHGSSIKEGEFQFYLNPDNEKGLPEGSYDNVAAVMPIAKKYGFVSGAGSSWKLITGRNPETKYKSLTEIETYLYSDQEELDTLMRSVIVHQRISKGHTALPPDGYLVSPVGRLVRLE